MDKKMEIELMPCPHCGGTDLQVDYNGVYDRHFVRCYNFSCHMQGPEVYGRDKASEAWNKLPRKLVFGDESPTVSGSWWWELLGHKGIDHIQDPEKRVVKDYRARWAGPIPEPVMMK